MSRRVPLDWEDAPAPLVPDAEAMARAVAPVALPAVWGSAGGTTARQERNLDASFETWTEKFKTAATDAGIERSHAEAQDMARPHVAQVGRDLHRGRR